MKKFLMFVLLATTAISCTNSSSSEAPPAGKDGEKQVDEKALNFGGTNAGEIQIDEPGKDLVLAVGFPLDPKMLGQIRVTEQKTDLEKAIEKAPKPLDPKVEAMLKKVCFLKDTPHRWVIRRQNIDTHFGSGQVVDFADGSAMYLVIETRSKPLCETLYYSFTSELLNFSRKPDPVVPTPTPEPAVPPGSESVLVVNPNSPANFHIEYDKGEGRNFTYKLSMLVNGTAFGQGLPVEKIFVNIYDKAAMNYVSEWMPVVEQPASVLPAQFRMQITLDKFSAPVYFIDRQKEMVLTFAVNAPDSSVLPVRSLELSKYCGNPQIRQGIIDRKTGATGCP
jgi:hypothetical protein